MGGKEGESRSGVKKVSRVHGSYVSVCEFMLVRSNIYASTANIYKVTVIDNIKFFIYFNQLFIYIFGITFVIPYKIDF